MTITFDPINRLIIIEAPATEVTIQELINAIRDWEDEQSSMGYPHIVEGSGKENLGGGVLVGITLKLLNWRVKFADRAGPDWIVCNIRGGNLVAVDENGESMYVVASASYVTVSLTSSSSATLLEEETLEIACFQGAVTIDIDHGETGTEFPIGTPSRPVNNLDDALIIANTNGIRTFRIRGMLVVIGDYTDWSFEGIGSILNDLLILSGGIFDDVRFKQVTVTGEMSESFDLQFYECIVADLSGIDGLLYESGVSGTITLAGEGSALLGKHVTAVTTPTVIDVVGTNRYVGMELLGTWKIINLVDGSVIASNILAGTMELDNSCGGGIADFEGIGFLIDNSNGSTVNNKLISEDIITIKNHDILRRKVIGDYILYYDNGTLVFRYRMVKDSEGNVIEVIPEAV